RTGCLTENGRKELFVRGNQPAECGDKFLASIQVEAEASPDPESTPELEPQTGTAVLIEERNGEQVEAMQLTPEMQAEFNRNPLEFINKYGAQLEADDRPTNIYIQGTSA